LSRPYRFLMLCYRRVPALTALTRRTLGVGGLKRGRQYVARGSSAPKATRGRRGEVIGSRTVVLDTLCLLVRSAHVKRLAD
jgi:hypothetical protein